MKCPNIQDDKRSHRKYAYLVSSLNSALKYATIDWFLVFFERTKYASVFLQVLFIKRSSYAIWFMHGSQV